MNKFFTSLFLLGLSNLVFSQSIGINTTGATPHPSSILDVSATGKGILIPRINIVSLAASGPVTSPETSLLVYNTNVGIGVGYYFWDGSKWTKLLDDKSITDHDWYKVGGVLQANDITDNIFTQGNVGIGEIAPTEKLEVVGSVKIVDGTEGVDKVFVSDAAGKGKWAALSNINGEVIVTDLAITARYIPNTPYIRVDLSSLTPAIWTRVYNGSGLCTCLASTSGGAYRHKTTIWAIGDVASNNQYGLFFNDVFYGSTPDNGLTWPRQTTRNPLPEKITIICR